MTTRQAVMKKLCSIVGKHNQRPAVVDQALRIFSSLAPGKHPLNKSVPTIDTTRREQLQAKQDSQDSDSRKKPAIKRKAFIETRSKTFAGITVIEWENGVVTVRPEQSVPDFVANFTPEQKRELLQLALKHLSEQATAKSADNAAITKALEKLDQLEKASKPPSKSPAIKFPRMLRISKKQTVEQKPDKPVKAVIQKETTPMRSTQPPEQPRTPWGCMPTLRDIADRRQSAQSPANRPFVPIDPKAPRMTVQEQQEFRLQQAREKEAARKPVSDKSNTASWL